MIILSTILFFLLALVISFIGSIQLGPVNLAVINKSLNSSYKQALWIGFGGAIPELFFSAAAFWFSNYLLNYPELIATLEWLMIPLFLGVGLFLFFYKSKGKQKVKKENISKAGPFFIGLTLGTLNPMLLPFWTLVIQYCISFGFNPHIEYAYEMAFIIGTAAGAFLLQFCLATIILKTKNRFETQFKKLANPITGLAFILLAIINLGIKLF